MVLVYATWVPALALLFNLSKSFMIVLINGISRQSGERVGEPPWTIMFQNDSHRPIVDSLGIPGAE
jgi:hypothetical protein